MAKIIELKNAKVTFSTMLHKDNKKISSRLFKVAIPLDSPELKEIIEQYKQLNEMAKQVYSEKLGKKLKNAKSVDDVFAESIYHEGFTELRFNVYYIRERDVEKDGETVKERIEVLNPIYQEENFCYKLDNNGKKVYELESGKKWRPAESNIVDIKFSLITGYSKQNNQPTIQLKAEEVKIVETKIGSNGGGNSNSGLGMLTLESTNESIQKQVEKAVPVKEDEMFTSDELSELDMANV